MFIIVCTREPKHQLSAKEYQWDYFGPFEGREHADLWLNYVHKGVSRTGSRSFPLPPDPQNAKVAEYNENQGPCKEPLHFIIEVKYPYTGFESHYY